MATPTPPFTFSPAHRRRVIVDHLWDAANELGLLQEWIHVAIDNDGSSMPAEQLWQLRQIDGDAQSYRAELTRQIGEWEKVL